MKTASFENTVAILVKAYLNDTLISGNPCGCAVGNIIRSSVKGIEADSFSLKDNQWATDWFENVIPNFHPVYHGDIENGRKIILETGYSVSDVIRIEAAFEARGKEDSTLTLGREKRMFNGLIAVVDVLAEIHNVDLSVKESAKQLFVKA